MVEDFIKELKDVQKKLNAIKGNLVGDTTHGANVREIIKKYFSLIRPNLEQHILETPLVRELDETFRKLHVLTQGRNRKSSYLVLFKSCIAALNSLSTIILSDTNAKGSKSYFSKREEVIFTNITSYSAVAANSYIQACLDLRSETPRRSHRGSVNELRECLRDLLDVLAPKNTVQSQPGFVHELNECKKPKPPTRRQQLEYFFRDTTQKKSLTTSIESFEMIETIYKKYTIDLFNDANKYAHSGAEWEDVFRIKETMELVVIELLNLHSEISEAK